MNEELMQHKGQLAHLKQKFEDLDIEASGLIMQLRIYLNPYTDDVTDLKVDQIKASSKRLYEAVTEMRRLKEKIGKLKEALGG